MGRRWEHIYFATMILVKLKCIVQSAISKSLRFAETQTTPLKMKSSPIKSHPSCPNQEGRTTRTNNLNKSIAGWFCNDGLGMDREHITELICQRIEVDDDNKALPENVEPDVETQGSTHEGVAVQISTGMLLQALKLLMVITRREESGGMIVGMTSRIMISLIFGWFAFLGKCWSSNECYQK